MTQSGLEKHDSDDSLPWKGLLLFRSLYFLDGLGGAAWGRFGIIFYNQVKQIPADKIGLLQGFRPIVSFFMKPFWGWLADQIQSRKSVYLFCKLGSTVSLITLAIPGESFLAVAISVVAMSLFPASGVLDAHTIDFLGDSHRGLYGSIRLWAAVSWGVGSVLMGFLTDSFGFWWNFVVFGVMMLFSMIFTAVLLPARSRSEQNFVERATVPKWSALFKAMFRWQVVLWLTQVTIMGAAMSLVDSFLFVYLQNDLHASTSLCGFTVGVTVMLEIPIFFHSKFLLHRLGHDGFWMVAMVAYIVRVLGYTLLTSKTVGWVLLLEVLHGITFACSWTAAIDFAAQIAPPEWSTLVQAVMDTCWGSLGGGLGPVLGGVVYERYGAVVLYRSAALIVGITMILHGFLYTFGLFRQDIFLQDRAGYQPLQIASDVEMIAPKKKQSSISLDDEIDPISNTT
jgi:MFS transporter, PPP family, 3-phenylpropionic acid transporter